MCGICGRFNFDNQKLVEYTEIKKMTDKLSHRGPDDEGIFISNEVGLGFRRLSIIDLAQGKQPMRDLDKSVCVVFNGEIYNFHELKRELEKNGHSFKTKSDTEVIVYGYKQWGINIFDHLNGMFAIAIWDEHRQQLIIARDRMGIKPLYYKIESDRLYFASEIRSILATNENKPALDQNAFYQFLRYRYTPSPLTIFKGIKKLAAGNLIIARNGTYNVKRWWDFKPEPLDPMPTYKQAQEKLSELYNTAVKRQLISDVPLGLLLSGGLDSGLLLALMKQNGTSDQTYTVGVGNTYSNDEISKASHTARKLNAKNHSVFLDKDTFNSTLSKIILATEEPVTATSIVPMYHVCKRAREDVKVVLMGQGPDELYGGYKRHLGVIYGKYWRELPKIVRSGILPILNTISRSEAIKRGLFSLDISDKLARYQNVFSLMSENDINKIFLNDILDDDLAKGIPESWQELFPLMENTDELGGFQFLELRSSLPDELLMYADKLSMVHGLEVRVPYLDHEIVEYSECLSSSYKIKYGSRKRIHRQICQNYLPREVISRRKIGFEVPVDEWFRESLDNRLPEILINNNSLIYNYLKYEEIQKIISQHRENRQNNFKILFSLVVLEENLRNNFN